VRRGAAAIAVAGLACPASAGAVSTAGPSGHVGAFPAFRITLDAGEDGARPVLYPSATATDGGSDVTTRATKRGLVPYDPLTPGRHFWRGEAYRGSERVRSEAREIIVRNATEIGKTHFRRRAATVTGSYVWRTNAERLTHRVLVFHNGRRVSRQVSHIAHRAGDRMAGETFAFRAALSDNTPPFGAVHPGLWKVRVSVTGAGKTDTETKRYRIS
jgi:hypothetical protein